ncbi:MAG TPA: hypothetical protein DDW81_05680 [Cryomorphaceae bacterium]|nr:hypothetical protein [Owenweeksia sp.]HBF19567.1 hypothetical protein [Cryomorphaceae bacterium]HCQ15859.1 hypothetical protein [Cryomorphaceae bacterium]|tara:strand:- start:408 stop:791 length:384 start_codon:yes stop_codon:yes gene_type:complete
MLQTNVETGKYQSDMEKAVNFVLNRGFEDIKARHGDYEEPATLRMMDQEGGFVPDITATKNGGKYYFEIANRNEDARQVVGKWKLMSTLARMKDGDFRIFVPYGSMKYTNEILEKKSIEAEVIKLPK